MCIILIKGIHKDSFLIIYKMSILDDDINLDMGIINHTCELYIKKYGVNSRVTIFSYNYNDPVQDVCDILHEYDSIDNPDEIFVYWTYMGWINSHPTYKLFVIL